MNNTAQALPKESCTLNEIFRTYAHRLEGLSYEQYKIVNAIARCRTEALGGHLYQCDACGHQEPHYHSCRNRHCPQCQSLTQAAWVKARREELFPAPYFHLVFTLPHAFNDLLLRNKQEGYGLLFKAVSSTLLTVGRQRLGGQMGFMPILHTWDQKMLLHPHLHCVVPGGALSDDETEWFESDKKYLMPVQILSEVFRGRFLSSLEKAFAEGVFTFPGKIQVLEAPAAFKALLKSTTKTDWGVYAKPTFKDPVKLVDYLGRYTHRIAISNDRLISLRNEEVTFTYLDRKGQKPVRRRLRLPVEEFMGRFMRHTLPTNFYRIRYYGFLANPVRKKKLEAIRSLLEVRIRKAKEKANALAWQEQLRKLTGEDVRRCPRCKQGQMQVIKVLPEVARPPVRGVVSRASASGRGRAAKVGATVSDSGPRREGVVIEA